MSPILPDGGRGNPEKLIGVVAYRAGVSSSEPCISPCASARCPMQRPAPDPFVQFWYNLRTLLCSVAAASNPLPLPLSGARHGRQAMALSDSALLRFALGGAGVQYATSPRTPPSSPAGGYRSVFHGLFGELGSSHVAMWAPSLVRARGVFYLPSVCF